MFSVLETRNGEIGRAGGRRCVLGGSGLLLSAALGLAASVTFFVVGRRLGAREPTEPRARDAHRGFRAWWFASAIAAFLSITVFDVLAFVGYTPPRLFVTLRTATIIARCVGIWGLAHYVTFLLTGWKGSRVAWAAGVGVMYVVLVWLFSGSFATGVRVGEFETQLVFEPALDPVSMGLAVALLTLPQLAAGIAFAFVAQRTSDPAARQRAFLVSASLAAWATMTILTTFQIDSPLVLARLSLGVVAAGCVLLAYAPPRSVAAWRASQATRASAFAARVRDLV